MDQGKSTNPSVNPVPPLHDSLTLCQQKKEEEGRDAKSSRKVQKADREKLRRDRLNEQFLELGQTLDADRPKNDKATILTETIQVLKDLTAEVDRLKSECSSLSDESKELNQEKNELKEEKATLKSEIDNLNSQYQQRARVMFPWTAVDPSVMMAPPYTYPVHVHVPPFHHPTMQPFPIFGNQAFMPYSTPNAPSQQNSTPQQVSTSQSSCKKDSKRKLSGDVATDLELKTPGSSSPRETSRELKREKQVQNKERSVTTSSASSLCSSSGGEKDSSSVAVGSS